MMLAEDMEGLVSKIVTNDIEGEIVEESNALFGAELINAFDGNIDALNNFMGRTGEIMGLVDKLYPDNSTSDLDFDEMLGDIGSAFAMGDIAIAIGGETNGFTKAFSAMGKKLGIVAIGVDTLQFADEQSASNLYDLVFSAVGFAGFHGTAISIFASAMKPHLIEWGTQLQQVSDIFAEDWAVQMEERQNYDDFDVFEDEENKSSNVVTEWRKNRADDE